MIFQCLPPVVPSVIYFAAYRGVRHGMQTTVEKLSAAPPGTGLPRLADVQAMTYCVKDEYVVWYW